MKNVAEEPLKAKRGDASCRLLAYLDHGWIRALGAAVVRILFLFFFARKVFYSFSLTFSVPLSVTKPSSQLYLFYVKDKIHPHTENNLRLQSNQSSYKKSNLLWVYILYYDELLVEKKTQFGKD